MLCLLQLFLRSLPDDCYFNIVGFGSRFTKLWPTSVKYSQDSMTQASSHIAGMLCLPVFFFCFALPLKNKITNYSHDPSLSPFSHSAIHPHGVLSLFFSTALHADLGGTEILQPLQDILGSKQIPEYTRQIFVLTDGEVHQITNNDE